MAKLHDKYAKGKESNGELLSYLVSPLSNCDFLMGVYTGVLEGDGLDVEGHGPDEEGVNEWFVDGCDLRHPLLTGASVHGLNCKYKRFQGSCNTSITNSRSTIYR